MLFTQANQYNLVLSSKAGAKSTSPRSAFRSNGLPSSASDPGSDIGGSGSGIGGGSGSNGNTPGPIFRFFSSLFGFGSGGTATTSKWQPIPSLATLRSSVQWLSSKETVKAANRVKLNTILKLLKQPTMAKAQGKKETAIFVPPDSKVTLEAEGVTNLTAAQATVPDTAPTPAQVSTQSYSQNSVRSYGAVEVLHDGDDDESRHHGGRQYRVECHDDDEEDDDEPECIEPTGRVRIFKYTSPQNVSYVILRAKSKCLEGVRKVQIRSAPYGKTGPLVMEIPGSWVLWDDGEIELVKHTFIANATAVIVSNGQTMEAAIRTITKAPWNYYVIFTTATKASGAIRGQLWKPFCPWCANYTFTG
ncbi:hypothetical protein CLOP_g19998 [Closterium sp. NIES-67]|nr:hypothetical protein CLOP_g19998 [Closterium sp. NIES-67]